MTHIWEFHSVNSVNKNDIAMDEDAGAINALNTMTPDSSKWVITGLFLPKLPDTNHNKVTNSEQSAERSTLIHSACEVIKDQIVHKTAEETCGNSKEEAKGVMQSNTNIIQSIANLTPLDNNHLVRAKVVAKSKVIRGCDNTNGDTAGFEIDFQDDSGEIRATVPYEYSDKYFAMMEVNKEYLVSKYDLKQLSTKKTSIPKSTCEMIFRNDTVVQQCEDSTNAIFARSETVYNFVPLSKIKNVEHNVTVDVIGTCKEIGQTTTVFSRYNKKTTYQKRNITLVDTCNVPTVVTFWNEQATNMSSDLLYQVLAIKSGRVNAFNGKKYIYFMKYSKMDVNPDLPECQVLKDWFKEGGNAIFTDVVRVDDGPDDDDDDVCNFHTFNESRSLKVGKEFKIKAVINLIDCEGAYYKACPKLQCPKKVEQMADGSYSCRKCKRIYSDFKFMLMLKIQICDGFTSEWLILNNEMTEELLGHTAQHIGETIYKNPAQAEQFFERIYFRTYTFTLLKKWKFYQGNFSLDFKIASISPVSYKEYNIHLINNLNKRAISDEIKNSSVLILEDCTKTTSPIK